MALKCWLGNAGSGKSYRLYEEVIKEAREHPDRTYLVIVPEQFTLQTQRDLVRLHPDGGILNIDVLSFARLSYRVFEEVGFAKAPGLLIDDMGKNLILRHLASEMEPELTVIGKNLKRLGYITEVKSVISEFMQYGVDADAIARLQQVCEQNNRHLLSEKLGDVSKLYTAFRKYIEEKYTTSEELLIRVSTALTGSEKLGRSVIVLDGFTGFTPVQYDLIRALLQKCIDVHVTVLLDTREGLDGPYDEQELFYLSHKTIRELKHIAEECSVPVLPDHVIADEIPYRFRISDEDGEKKEAPQMLIHLEKNLFREKQEPFDKISDDIQLITARNPLDELRYVAVLIERLVREKQYRYKDIAVVTGELTDYMHTVTRVFNSYGIPFFVDKKQPILQNPFIEYLRAIMRVLTEDYSHDGMFSYLKSSMLDHSDDQINLLENYCIACGIHGKRQWNRQFTRKPRSFTPEQLKELNKIREEAVKPFLVFDNAKTVRDYCTALFQMLESVQTQQKLHDRAEAFLKQGMDVKAREYEQILQSVLSLLDKLVELLGEEAMEAEEFLELLDAGFAELRVGVIPNRTDYVQVGDLLRSRFRDIKALFFVGVNDGIIPKSADTGGLLSDLDREFFLQKSAGVELAPSAKMQAYTQRLYLYMVMTKPTERLYLSYAGVSTGGESLMPSYLIDELKSMFPDLLTTHYDTLPVLERVYTAGTALSELAGGLQPFIRGETHEEAAKLLKYFAQKTQFADVLKNMINSAFPDKRNGLTDSVGAAIAHVIYGEAITGSVTRLETYAKCAYEHFLRYGLNLKRREEFSFEVRDMGSVFHAALEAFSGQLEDEGLTWAALPDEAADRICDLSVKKVIADYDSIYASFRSSYMIERIRRILKKTVRVLRAQIQAGDFVPSRFEFDFAGRSDLSSIHFKLSESERMDFAGRIDRMDVLEEDNKIYVKIIDYKSGKQDLDLAAIYRGEQLQLVVYMNAAMELEASEHPDKEVLPAGILYYHLDDPMIEADAGEADEAIWERILATLKMKGLVNADEQIYSRMDRDFSGSSSVIPVTKTKDGLNAEKSSIATTEEFKVISDYVNRIIADMGRTMLDGNITATGRNCTYCEFAGVCGKAGTGKTEPAVNAEEIIEKMREKLQ
ncbi:MAG: PD-(D/E)XK nuclease family protein [Lachnospiraceae bacterium]|nr:PD-(D/E)XK nuclease family protein [Lachnospiraceae bacterium]